MLSRNKSKAKNTINVEMTNIIAFFVKAIIKIKPALIKNVN